jgi:hypothetical protein
MTTAKIESRHDCGAPETMRDDDGNLWRVAADAADGTLAVEEIDDYGGGPTITVTADYRAGRCAVARWNEDDTPSLAMVRGIGENHTDPAEYQAGGDVWKASPDGWVAYCDSLE